MPEIQLDSHHRSTLEKIFNHPVSHNIQWHDVLSLLQSVAEVKEHETRVTVTLGSETETFDVHRHHELSEEQVVDVRRMLKGAGVTPEQI